MEVNVCGILGYLPSLAKGVITYNHLKCLFDLHGRKALVVRIGFTDSEVLL